MNTSQTDRIEDTNEDETFAALSKAVAEGNTDELNRLLASDGEQTATEVKEEKDPVDEATSEETTEETEEKEDKSEQPQSEKKTDTETVNEAAPAASTPAADDVEAMKRELHALRSDKGRMRHVQSRMHQLENELRAYKARSSNSTTETAEPAKKELPGKLNEKLKQLKEIDPDLAETFELFAGMVQDTERVAKETVASSINEQHEVNFWQSQREELLQAIPQADQIFATPEWKQWKSQLTPGRRALTESGYAVEMVQAIHAFAADMQAIYGKTQSSATTSTSSEGGDPKVTNVDTQQNAEVNEERKRKLTTATAAKTTAAKATAVFDADAEFSEIYNKLRKQNHIG